MNLAAKKAWITRRQNLARKTGKTSRPKGKAMDEHLRRIAEESRTFPGSYLWMKEHGKI